MADSSAFSFTSLLKLNGNEQNANLYTSQNRALILHNTSAENKTEHQSFIGTYYYVKRNK